MADEFNPYQAPASNAGESIPVVSLIEDHQARFVFNVKDNANKPWTVRASDNMLQFQNEKGDFHELVRGRDSLFPNLMSGFLIRNCFVLKLGKQLVFRFEPDDYKVLKDWVGPATESDLKTMAGKFFAFGLPLGVIFLLVGISELNRGPKDFFQPIYHLFIGATLALGWLLAKYKPHRILFVLGAFLFGAFAVVNVYSLCTTPIGGSWFVVVRAALALFFANLALVNFRRYRAFANVVPDPIVLFEL